MAQQLHPNPRHGRPLYKQRSSASPPHQPSSDRRARSTRLDTSNGGGSSRRRVPRRVLRLPGRVRADVQRHLQLRRLHVRHRQPLRERPPRRPDPHPAALRRDLLRPRHLPLLRRPPRRRLPRREVRAAAAEAVEAGRLRLQEGREHGDHRRHHHGLGLLPVAGHRRQDLEQRAPQHPDPVVQAAHALHLRLHTGLQVVPVQVPVRAGRVRRQRLQRHDLRRLLAGAGERAERHHRGRHRQGRGAADRAGRRQRGGPGGPPRGVLPHLPDAVPDLQRRRLRPVRLPAAVQRAVGAAQPAAAEQGDEPAGPVPGRPDHVRRLLQPRLRHGPEPRELRVQHQPQGLLRRRRRQVQLPERRAVRHGRRVGVRQPGGVAQLGRHPPHGGGVQEDRRRVGQRGVLPPGHWSLEGAPGISIKG